MRGDAVMHFVEACCWQFTACRVGSIHGAMTQWRVAQHGYQGRIRPRTPSLRANTLAAINAFDDFIGTNTWSRTVVKTNSVRPTGSLTVLSRSTGNVMDTTLRVREILSLANTLGHRWVESLRPQAESISPSG